MKDEAKNKRVAVAVSLAVHVLVFGALAAGGVFSFLQSKAQPSPVEVTMYDDDAASTTPTPGSAAPAPSGGSQGGGESYSVPQNMPAINESFTQEVQTQRAIKQVMQEQGVDAEKAKEVVQQKQAASSNTAATATNTSAASSVTAVGTVQGGEKEASPGGQGSSGTPAGGGNGAGGSGQGSGAGAGTTAGRGSGTGGGESAQPARPPQKARLVSQPDASAYYPESLRKQNVSATVVVSVQIGPDGSVTNASVISSSGYPDMDAAAVQLAYACHYEPARDSSGNAVSTTKGLTVPFQTR